jgi:hypothetical protein
MHVKERKMHIGILFENSRLSFISFILYMDRFTVELPSGSTFMIHFAYLCANIMDDVRENF